MAEHPKIAWGDESIRVSAPNPAYIMAATVLPGGCDFSRLAQIKPKTSGKLHWRELTDKIRREALREVAAIGGQTMIVVATPLPKKKQERGRRKCLEVLLPALEEAGVDTLVLESRILQLNSKDIDMLDALRVRHAVSRIGIEHAHADEEPSLWVPDQILGAFGDDLCGDVRDTWRQPWEEIRPSLTVLQSGM